MKGYRVLGGLMFGLGCAVAFVGLLAFGLPLIDNNQLQLVLTSFAMPSRHPLINAVNGMMTFALRSCYLVMAIGAALAALGACLMLRHSPRVERQPVRSPYERPPQERRTARPPRMNQPARPAAPTVNKAKRAVHPKESINPKPFIHYTNQPIETQSIPFSAVEAARASAYAPPEGWTKPLIPGADDAPAPSASAPKPAELPKQAEPQPTEASMAATSFAPIATNPSALNEPAEASTPSQSSAQTIHPASADEPTAQEAPPTPPPSRIRSTMGRHS